MIASIRRTFAALEDSERILKTPTSAVLRACVPPHSSRENEPSPTSTMRTTSPYFSPKSAIAPSARASSSVVVSARTGWSARDPRIDLVLDVAQLVGAEALGMGEVEAQLVGADVGAGLAHVGAQPRAQRRVQEVGRGVVGLGRVARPRVDARDHPLAGLELALLDHDGDRLVVAHPEDVGHAGAAVAVLAGDLADVGDLPAARRRRRATRRA